MIRPRERWSYAAGDLGFNFVWQSVELYLLFFYIRGLGLPAATASAIFLAGAAVDWAVDPLVGLVADRAAPRVPMRSWVIVGGPLSVLMLVLAFTPPALPAPLVPVAALLTYLALRVAYGVGNIPYAALTARMSPLPSDHLALTGTRMQGAAVGGLVATGIYLTLPAHAAGADFRQGALLLAALAMPAFLATWAGVRERVAGGQAGGRGGVGSAAAEAAALLRRSPALRRLLATILAGGLAVTVVNKSLLFLFEELGVPRIGFWVALVPSASLLLTAPAWTRLGARLGRPRALVLAAGLKASAGVLALAIGGIVAVAVLTTLAIVAGCGLSILFWSLVPAAIADCERACAGTGCAGRVYALANVARKLGQALAPVIVTATLSVTSVAPWGASTLWGMTLAALSALAVVVFYGPAEPAAATAPAIWGEA